MKRVLWTLLSLVCAAAILAGGYFGIDFFDRLLTPGASVTQVKKDGDANAVLRFDKGAEFRLYPFDELDESVYVAAYPSERFTQAYRNACAGDDSVDRTRPITTIGDRLMTISEFYKLVNENIYYNITARVVTKEQSVVHTPLDLLSATRYQASNDTYYIQDFPLTVVQNGTWVTRQLTAAFRTDFWETFEWSFLSLAPPETEADVSVDWEQVADDIYIQFDKYKWQFALDEVKGEGGYSLLPITQTKHVESEEKPSKNIFESAFERFDIGVNVAAQTNGECVLYGDEVLFVIQGGSWRLVLQYSPMLGEFYGASMRRSI